MSSWSESASTVAGRLTGASAEETRNWVTGARNMARDHGGCTRDNRARGVRLQEISLADQTRRDNLGNMHGMGCINHSAKGTFVFIAKPAGHRESMRSRAGLRQRNPAPRPR